MANNAINLENIWTTIGDEIEIHKSRLEPHDTGHLHTAISVIKRRIEEIT